MQLKSVAIIVVFFASCSCVSVRADAPQAASYRGWQGYVWDNGIVRLHVVPDLGGRIVQFALGEKEFFWVNPTLVGKMPPPSGLAADGGWLNYGGDKLWPAPQGWDHDQQWPGPPDAVLDGQPYQVDTDVEPAGIRLTSRDDPHSGIRFSRLIRLHPNSTHVSVEATMTNVDTKPRRWGIWAHTQLDAGLKGSDGYNALMRAWCPINPRSRFQRGYQVIFGEQQSASFQADSAHQMMKVSYRYEVGKIGLDSDAGWVATVDGRRGDVFVQRFQFEPSQEYPDGSSVEFWHNGLGRIHAYGQWIDQPDNRVKNPYIFESEILSPFASLQPAEQYTWTYHWYACRIGGDFPVIDCTEAGLVSEPLTYRAEGEQVRLRGRLGVFHLGRLVWEATDVGGELLQSDMLVSAVTPREPILLDHLLQLPCQTASLTLVLQDAAGKKIGGIARAQLGSPPPNRP